MTEINSQKTVFVGLSGGVDSSVAAKRLLEQGFKVVGVFIKVWQPEFLECDWESERLDAMRVAAHLKIPFLTCDAEEAYKKHVGDYFVNEYLRGRTPNPDVMCNRFVKFGAFWEFAKSRGADYIATGHYARIEKEGEEYHLYKATDTNKDQSYFLWQLTPFDLEHILFPLGNTTKDEVRKEAERAGLPTAIKKDSQGVCFLGHIDIPEFMTHFVDLKKGDVLNSSREVVGQHVGALVYTIGQRHGFTIFKSVDNTAHFVVEKDLDKNIIVVDTKAPFIKVDSQIKVESLNLIGRKNKDNMEAAFRYRQKPVSILFKTNQSIAQIELRETTEKPASGQSVVFYDGERCLGGAVVV